MLLLKTKWGDYLLHNALRIDFHRAKEKETWLVYICIDSFKHVLQGFETERDAFVFADKMRNAIRLALVESWGSWAGKLDEEDYSLCLNGVCEAALEETIKQGEVE